MKITVERTVERSSKKPQFSKVWLGCCIIISLIFTAASYVLSYVDKDPVVELSKEVLEVMWGSNGVSFLGYVLQNCVRAYTASKFGIPKEEKNDKY